MDILDYSLPEELIAQEPEAERDQARLMVIDRGSGGWQHRRFYELGAFLESGDLLILNDTAVFPARLRGQRAATRGKVELLLLEPRQPGQWSALLRCGSKPGPGTRLSLADGAIEATILERLGGGQVLIEFLDPGGLDEELDRHGEIPLPPYIDPAAAGHDAGFHRRRYQTVFARHRGAVAAPTAGLHFTPELLQALRDRGIAVETVTLHVGLGTFRPIRADAIEAHVMHGERYRIPAATLEAIARTRREGGRIIACGTTAVRSLESYARSGETEAVTELFIRPPYDFQLVDGLITNFHLPRTTLLLLVAALLGADKLRAAYEEAIRERYRFYSYGDAMLIL